MNQIPILTTQTIVNVYKTTLQSSKDIKVNILLCTILKHAFKIPDYFNSYNISTMNNSPINSTTVGELADATSLNNF